MFRETLSIPPYPSALSLCYVSLYNTFWEMATTWFASIMEFHCCDACRFSSLLLLMQRYAVICFELTNFVVPWNTKESMSYLSTVFCGIMIYFFLSSLASIFPQSTYSECGLQFCVYFVGITIKCIFSGIFEAYTMKYVFSLFCISYESLSLLLCGATCSHMNLKGKNCSKVMFHHLEF